MAPREEQRRKYQISVASPSHHVNHNVRNSLHDAIPAKAMQAGPMMELVRHAMRAAAMNLKVSSAGSAGLRPLIQRRANAPPVSASSVFPRAMPAEAAITVGPSQARFAMKTVALARNATAIIPGQTRAPRSKTAVNARLDGGQTGDAFEFPNASKLRIDSPHKA
jgi:hypothetical protein